VGEEGVHADATAGGHAVPLDDVPWIGRIKGLEFQDRGLEYVGDVVRAIGDLVIGLAGAGLGVGGAVGAAHEVAAGVGVAEDTDGLQLDRGIVERVRRLVADLVFGGGIDDEGAPTAIDDAIVIRVADLRQQA
jgi:hypothetical protein